MRGCVAGLNPAPLNFGRTEGGRRRRRGKTSGRLGLAMPTDDNVRAIWALAPPLVRSSPG